MIRAGAFTLVELLVVLLLIGIVAALIGAVRPPDDRAAVEIEARRMATVLELAATTARVSGRAIAWTADGRGYRFWRRQPDARWTEIHDDDALRGRTLPDGMALAGLVVESAPVRGDMRLEFLPHAPPPTFALRVTRGGESYAVTGSPVGEIREARITEPFAYAPAAR